MGPRCVAQHLNYNDQPPALQKMLRIVVFRVVAHSIDLDDEDIQTTPRLLTQGKIMNMQTPAMIAIGTFKVDTFGMDFLAQEMCPVRADIQLSGEALMTVKKACTLIEAELFIKSISIEPSALQCKLVYFNEGGKEINIEEQMDLKIQVDAVHGYARLSIVLSANDTQITDEDSEETYTCDGEFFGEVALSALQSALTTSVPFSH